MNIRPIRTAIIVISIARSTIRFEILCGGHFCPYLKFVAFVTQFGTSGHFGDPIWDMWNRWPDLGQGMSHLPWWKICIIEIVSINQMFETEIHETKNIDDWYSQWIRWLFMVFIQFHFSIPKISLTKINTLWLENYFCSKIH